MGFYIFFFTNFNNSKNIIMKYYYQFYTFIFIKNKIIYIFLIIYFNNQ